MRKEIRKLPWEERMRLYQKAMKLRKKHGWGYVRIGRAIDVHHGVVRHWIHHGRNPENSSRICFLNTEPSPELAYVIGVIYGDGDLPTRGKLYDRTGRYVRLRVNDKEFIEEFIRCIDKVLGKTKVKKIGRERKQYRVIYHSYYLHEFLKKPLNDLKPFIEANPRGFIKGVVDSEGSVTVSPIRWENYRWLQLYIDISNTNRELLNYTMELLDKFFGIESRIRLSYAAGTTFNFLGRRCVRKKDAYDLIIGKLEHVRKFYSQIGFTITSKQSKLFDALELTKKFKNRSDRYHSWHDLYHKVNNRWVKTL